MTFCRATLGLAVVMCAVGCRETAAPGKPAATLAVRFEPDTYQLTAKGILDREQSLECPVVNRSGRACEIVRVTTTCGCTLAEPLEQTRLAAGATIPIRLKVVIPAYGEKRVTVGLETQPAQAEPALLTLVLQGGKQTLPDVESQPQELMLSGVVAGRPVERFAELVTRENLSSPPWIVGVAANEPDIRAYLEHVPADQTWPDNSIQRTYRVRVETMLPDDADLPRRLEIRYLTSDQAELPPLRVKGVLFPVARVVPQELRIKPVGVASEEPLSSAFMIVAEDIEDVISVERWEASASGIEIIGCPTDEPRRVQKLTVKISPDRAAADLLASQVVQFRVHSRMHGPSLVALTLRGVSFNAQ